MALVLADRVLETSTSEGLGTFALAGAQTGYQTFSNGIGDGNTCYYTINGQTTEQWEVGIGTVGAGTLARTTLISSNTGSFINFVAGVKNVFVTQPASKSIYKDANGDAIPLGSASATQLDITAQGDLRLQDTTGGQYVALQAPSTIATSYTLTMPADDGTAGQALITDGSGVLSWSTAASGDVYGPASATDNAVARYDGTTGKIIQNSVVTIADTTGDMTGVGTLNSGAITTTGVLTLPAGTVSAPALTTTGDTNTGMFFPAADTIAFTEGGVEAMRITSAGNVGIGTASPDANLTVNGAASFAAGTALLPSIARASDLNTGFWFPAADTIAASTAGSERLRLDSSGNLGLGVTPSAWAGNSKPLQSADASFWGTTSLTGYTSIGGNYFYDGTYKYIKTSTATDYYQYQGAHAWRTAPSGTAGNAISFTQAMTLDASGNLGIGTTTPTVKLDALSSGNTQVGRFRTGGLDTTDIVSFERNDSAVKAVINYNGTDGAISFGTTTNHPLAFDTNNTERMRILATGAVGIGTSSPAAKLDVNGDYQGAGNIITSVGFIRSPDGSAAEPSIQPGVDGDTGFYRPTTNTIGFSTAGSERMRINSSGNVGIGTASPNASAILDVQSTTKGVRMPNMTTTQKNAIASPAAGLMVYDTTLSKLCVYTTAWETITSL